MAWYDDLKNRAASAYESMATEVKKYKNDNFKNAATAACAMVAGADGRIDNEEVEEFLGFVLGSALNVFPIAEVDASFRAIAGKITANPTVGQAEALQIISKLKGKPEAMLVAGIAKSVAEKKDGIDEKERAVLRKICIALAVDPSLFDA